MDKPSSTPDDVLADGCLSVREAVKFSGLSRAELYLRMGDGRLAYVKHGVRRLIPKKSLVELLAANLTPAGGR